MTIACSKAGSVRLVRSKGNASGRTAVGKFSFQPPRAAPSAAQEEDRSDIEDTDHHGGSNLHCAMSTWQWSNDHCRVTRGLMVRDARRRASRHEGLARQIALVTSP